MIFQKSSEQSLPVVSTQFMFTIISITDLVIDCVPSARSPEARGMEPSSLVMREPGHMCQNHKFVR